MAKSMFPVKHPGALHKALGVAAGKKIPAKKMAKAAKSKSPHVREMVQYAENMQGRKTPGFRVGK